MDTWLPNMVASSGRELHANCSPHCALGSPPIFANSPPIRRTALGDHRRRGGAKRKLI